MCVSIYAQIGDDSNGNNYITSKVLMTHDVKDLSKIEF